MKKNYDCPPGKKLMRDPVTKKTFSVDIDEYNSAHHDFWAFQSRLRRAGLCLCPRNLLWQCTGDCIECYHYNHRMMVSLDAPVDSTEDNLSGHEVYTTPCLDISEHLEHRELMDALHAALRALPEKEFIICSIIMADKPDTEGMSLLNLTRAQYRYLKSKVLSKLYSVLVPYRH